MPRFKPDLLRSAAAPAADHDISHRVRVAQMIMIFQQTAPASLAATLFAFALAIHLRGHIPDPELLFWLVLKVAVIVPRVIHGRLFERRQDDSLRWLTWGKLMLLADGIAWGSVGLFLLPHESEATITVVIATLAGVASVAAFVLHVDWEACVAYTAPMLLPTALVMVTRGDSFGLYGGFAVLIFLALLLLAARRSERNVVEMLQLRFTNERLTAQLSEALELARHENRVKNEFVTNMSHELRTPLHGILGLSNMLLGDVPVSNPKGSVAVIRRCGEHLLGLINNILDFSRFGASGIDLHPQEVDVSQLVLDTVEMCRPGATERQLTLACTITLPQPCLARVDPFRLRQILLNLVGNAVKFTEEGTVQVLATTCTDGQGLRLRVQDTGVGIAPSVRDRIFEPFVQADTSNSRQFGGTGLGLSITHAICKAMGGTISYSSTLGEGTVFEVNLPLQRIDAQHSVAGSRLVRAAQDTSHVRGTVLLAEDNDVNAVVAEFALKQLGMVVERASNGLEVVERMCQDTNRPDLVLLDCQMPKMDGFEAARQVRDYERRLGLPPVALVALTANVFPQDREECQAAGMDDFLAKPFTTDQLRTVLATYLPRAA